MKEAREGSTDRPEISISSETARRARPQNSEQARQEKSEPK